MRGVRFLARSVVLTGGLPLACVFSCIPFSVCLVLIAVPQLPGWAQGPVQSWAAGTPRGSGSVAPLLAQPTGEGFTGPASFLCMLPPTYGYLTDSYGSLRSGGHIHRGIDYGTYYRPVDVRTPFGGQVVYSGPAGSYGLLVVIENAGYRLYLAHHSELDAQSGQVLVAGDVVGRSGETGNASGIHVHLEIRIWDGERWAAVDPERIRLPGQTEYCPWETLFAQEVP